MYFQYKWHGEKQKDDKERLDQNWNTEVQTPDPQPYVQHLGLLIESPRLQKPWEALTLWIW